jgi:hypothetical protein
MGKLPFKEIDAHNWLKPDPVVLHFAGTERARDYVETVLAPKLSGNVPEEIRKLFEVARSAVLYGYLFYPLYTLGMEQLFRIGEGAIASRCEQLGIPKDKKKFSDRIDWLAERGMFDRGEFSAWHALRRLRNSASHPDRQSIDTPGSAIGFLAALAEDINILFESEIQDSGDIMPNSKAK